MQLIENQFFNIGDQNLNKHFRYIPIEWKIPSEIFKYILKIINLSRFINWLKIDYKFSVKFTSDL